MEESGQSALSVRERQLLKLAAGGLTDTAIAQRLRIGEGTVSTYWRRIRTKIGPHSRTELVAMLLRHECERIVSALVEENRALLERLRVQSASTAGTDFYRQLVEQAADAILVIAHDGTIQMLNESASNLFGWSQDELRGRPISDLVPVRFREPHGHLMRSFFSNPARRAMGDHAGTPALHRSGVEIPIAANLSSVGEREDAVVICVVRAMRIE